MVNCWIFNTFVCLFVFPYFFLFNLFPFFSLAANFSSTFVPFFSLAAKAIYKNESQKTKTTTEREDEVIHFHKITFSIF